MLQQDEFDSLTATRDFSRRDFVATAVGSGFAAAVLPVSAQTIHTDDSGLIAGEVSIAAGDFHMPAYRAAPAGTMASGEKAPVVLVVSEIFGVHEHIADVARRLAKQGYLAIAPELFARQGDAKRYTDIPKLMTEVVGKKPDAQTLSDLDAAVAWAGANGGNTDKLGITGFCWGGRIVWLYAAHSAKVRAGVAWYGRLVGANSALAPRQPLDVAGVLHGPVLGLYGAQDEGIPQDSIAKMKTALAAGNAASRKSEFVVYPQASHAFHADYRPSYRKDAAEDGWKRCLAWFRSHGVA